MLTSDWSDDDLRYLAYVALQLDCDAIDIASCWMSESGLRTTAHNPTGNAAGLFQAMPDTLAAMGFSGGPTGFCALSVQKQLDWALVYYRPHKGRLMSPGACYLATFLPAYMAHANEPLFVLCSTHMHPIWYAQNKVFDADGKGYITVGDLTRRIQQVTTGPRWHEFVTRLTEYRGDPETLPPPPPIDLESDPDDTDPPPPDAA